MFDEINTVPWSDYGMPEAPKYIQDLVSDSEHERDIAFDTLKDYAYDRLSFSYYVTMYLLRIIELKDGNVDVPLLLQFILNTYITAQIRRKNSSNQSISNKLLVLVQSGIDLYKELLTEENQETRDAAQDLVEEITNYSQS